MYVSLRNCNEKVHTFFKNSSYSAVYKFWEGLSSLHVKNSIGIEPRDHRPKSNFKSTIFCWTNFAKKFLSLFAVVFSFKETWICNLKPEKNYIFHRDVKHNSLENTETYMYLDIKVLLYFYKIIFSEKHRKYFLPFYKFRYCV